MKQFKTLLFAAILFMGATSFTQAQSKVAHINTNELIEAMPQMKIARTDLEKLGKTYEAAIQEMATEYQRKIKQYQAEVETKTPEENGKRAEEVQTIEQSIRQYQSTAQEDIQKKESELMKPIFEKAKTAIQKVAKAQGFQYVLDSTQGSGVLLADGKDLMADVKKELGF